MSQTAARFGITIDGYEIASFSELARAAGRASTVDFMETAGGSFVLKLPVVRGVPLTFALSRPRTGDTQMWAWHEAALLGDMTAARKSASLVIYDYDGGKSVARYAMTKAWPSKIELGGLKAGSSGTLMETVTITCEHIQRVA